MYSVFGYGSLIFPPSAVARFADLPPIDPVYEAGLTTGDAGLVREEAVAAWEARGSEFTVVPARIRGFRREYTYASWRGGAMLEARYTGEESDVMNGLLISGYSEEEYAEISESEVGYDVVELEADDFVPYTGEPLVLAHPVSVYVPAEGSWEWPVRQRNQTYHARILEGVAMIREEWGEVVAEQFERDFVEYTFEPPLVGGTPVPLGVPVAEGVRQAWLNTVAENDRARAGFVALFG